MKMLPNQILSFNLSRLNCWKSSKYNLASEVKFMKNLTREGNLI